jgi:signal transduction histidine kinase
MDKTELERGLDAIERSCTLQARLIDDVLDVSRIITGKLRLSIQPVQLAMIVEQSI